MSVSSDHVASNLYCSESASELIVPLDAEVCKCIRMTASDFVNDNESSIAHMFDSENDQILGLELLRGLLNCDEFVTARCEAIDWMLKVRTYYNFRHETAYLSVNYLDRFLCSRALPEGKRWAWQLLSVACLSLAAKMEETRVPLLLDLQVTEPKFMFKPKTVQKMEILVMATLRWRLRLTTPFDFLDYFIAKLRWCFNSTHEVDHLSCVVSGAWDLILSSCRVMDFLNYTPSTIAAASLLYVIGQNYASDQKIVNFHEGLSKDMVKRCHHLFKKHSTINSFQPVYNKQKAKRSIQFDSQAED